MDKLDRILKELIGRRPSTEQGADCLSEERFAEYLGNLLGPPQREEVERHLTRCESCFQKSILFSRVVSDVQEKERRDRLQKIIDRTGEIIEVVLDFGKDAIRVISDPSGVCSVPEPAALSIRGGKGGPGGPRLVKLSRKFSGIAADILIEKTGDDRCEIEAAVSDPVSGDALDDIRLNLMSAGRELASYLTVQGHVTFKNLNIDTYTLMIFKGKDLLGTIVLKRHS